MQFENTLWIIAGLAAGAGLGWAFHRSQQGRIQMLGRFASHHLLARLTESVSPGRRRLKQVLLTIAVFSVFVALARPQVGFRWEEARRKGIDIMLALDTSKSMLARDVAPNRLERSKLGIMDFVDKLGGDRVGLIPFAGEAFLMTPLTLDYGAFLESLRAVDTRTIPRGGTNVAAAIREAERAFVDDAKQKILVLITDGEDLEGEGLAAAKAAAESGVTIHTIGVGTPAGELIPAGQTGREGSFVKDEAGQVVKSRLDEAALEEIASVTGGTYHPLGSRGEGLTMLYGEQLNLIPKQELSERMRKVPIERFEWPLALALLLLLCEFGIGERKSRRALRVPEVETADRRLPRAQKAAAVLAMLGCAASLPVSTAQATPQQAMKAYEAGNYEAAQSYYESASEREPASPELHYNLGVAAYRNANFEKSIEALKGTLKTTDLELQNEAYYNLGNALYRKGQATEQAQPEATIKQWKQALEAYEGAMALEKGDADAKYNYEFVKRRLEELEKQQQQRQQQQQQNQQQQSNQDQQNQQNQSQQNQDQESKDQQKESAQNQNQQDEQENQSAKDHQSNGQSARNDPQEQSSGQESGKEPKPDGQNDDKERKQRASSRDGDQQEKEQKGDGDPQSAKAEPESGKENEGEKEPAVGQRGEGRPMQQASGGRRVKPGQMSKEEAERLLDSLKSDDQQVLFAPEGKGAARAAKNREYQDW